MFDRSRRDLIRALGALPLLSALPGSAEAARRFQPQAIREVDISGYDTLLLPREHGQLARMTKVIQRRYPSRDHCLQMAAFFNKKRGLLVIGNDPLAGMADWQILPGDRLRVHFYGSAPQLQVIGIEPTVAAAAAQYRHWALQQAWAKGRNRSTRKLNFISVASGSPMSAERRHQEEVLRNVKGSLGVWFTQWRRHPFDRLYPDYAPAEPIAFAGLLSHLKANDVLAFPYINGMLWDANLAGFRALGRQVALRRETLDFSSYNAKLDFLRYACPYAKAWQSRLAAARDGVRDLDNQPASGVYLDMLAAAPPQPCWAADHGHEPGDPFAWQQGVRALLRQMKGAIMVEGCAEIYIDQVDYMLMHLHTDQPDTVPLWSAVYGDQPQPVGWKLAPGATAAQVADAAQRARQFGALPTPWMTREPESSLFRRGVLDVEPPASMTKAMPL